MRQCHAKVRSVMVMATAVALVTLAHTSDFPRLDARWSQFRGSGASGVALEGDFPIHFGPDSNVVWKTALPGGHSSPCVWQDRIFLTGFAAGQLETICVDRRDGGISWRRSIAPGKFEQGSRLSNPAASTPVTDGQRLFVYFGCFGLVGYDLEGNELWRKPLPVPVTQHGASSSPVLAGDRVFVACDGDVDAHLLAVDARSGKTLWKAERPSFRRGFSTPLLCPPGEPEIIVVAGTLRLVAYDIRDGAERWSVAGLPNEMVASPVFGAGLIFAAGWTPGSGVSRLPAFDALLENGDRDKDQRLTRDEAPPGPAKQHFVYVDANKDGFVDRAEWESISKIFDSSQNALMAAKPDGKVVWKQSRGIPYVPSPLYYDGRVYLIKNGGLASCFDAQSGEIHYLEERLGVIGDFYSSPVAGSGMIYAAAQSGVICVYEAGDELRVLARNAIGEPILATPALVDDHLYVRTSDHLFAFGR